MQVMKRLANDWLLVAETCGATDGLAVELATRYAAALDLSKTGGNAGEVPAGVMPPRFAFHLQERFAGQDRYKNRFTVERDSVLARLHALDGSGQIPDQPMPDNIVHLLHPDFPSGSQRFKDEVEPLVQKWRELYKQYRKEVSLQLKPFGDDWSDEKLRAFDRIMEEYRARFIGDRSDAELESPPYPSPLLTEAAAVYLATHEHYWVVKRRNEAHPNEPPWRVPSLKFAWHVAGDYFITIKVSQLRQDRGPSSRRGAASVCDPQKTMGLWAGLRHRRHIPLSQTPDL